MPRKGKKHLTSRKGIDSSGRKRKRSSTSEDDGASTQSVTAPREAEAIAATVHQHDDGSTVSAPIKMEIDNAQPELVPDVRAVAVRSTNSSQSDVVGPPEPEVVAVMVHRHGSRTD